MSMKMANGWSEESDETAAIKAALAMVEKGLEGAELKFLTVFTTGKKYDGAKIYEALKAALKPGVKFWGLNSDVDGVVATDGIHLGISLMGFASDDLGVGVSSVQFDWQDVTRNNHDIGEKAINAILQDAGKDKSDPPKLIFFAGLNLVGNADILRGIQDVIGEVPMYGGNTGEHQKTLTPGDGYVLSPNGAETSNISVAGLWFKSKFGTAYGYGYVDRPECSGVVTKSDPQKRIIYEIDGKPAAQVYNEWTGGAISDIIKAGGGDISMPVIGKYEIKKPLQKGSVDYISLAFMHVFPDGSVFTTFDGVEEGIELTLMEIQSEHDVIDKPAIVTTIARNRAALQKDEIAGAMILYCYTLLHTAEGLGYKVSPSFPIIKQSLGGAPFMGFFSGGEIGYSPNFGAEGNRMMGFSNVAIVFGKN